MDAKNNLKISILILLIAFAALYFLNTKKQINESSNIATKQITPQTKDEEPISASSMPAAAKLNVTSTEPKPGQLQVGTAENPPEGLPEDLRQALKNQKQELPEDLRKQLQSPPPELPDDLKAQLNGPAPELPEDLKAQLNSPPPEIPEDIKRALATPPREVSIEEVNTPPELR